MQVLNHNPMTATGLILPRMRHLLVPLPEIYVTHEQWRNVIFMILQTRSTHKCLLFSNACTLGTCPSTHCIGDTAIRRAVTRCREFDKIGTVYYRQFLRHWRYFFLLFLLVGFLACRRIRSFSSWFRLTPWCGCWRWKQRLLQLAFVWRACNTFSVTDTMFRCISWTLLVWQWNQITKRH